MRHYYTHTCEFCGSTFERAHKKSQAHALRFCSLRCHYDATASKFELRFWTSVRKSDGCWFWIGRKNTQGYGTTTWNNKRIAAHRASWILANGPIPDGLWILHHCDTPACVNPAHLFLGTARDNTHDMIAKGRQRQPIGEQIGLAVLTEEKVREIRRLCASGLTIAAVARQYGVTAATVSVIKSRKTWKHVS